MYHILRKPYGTERLWLMCLSTLSLFSWMLWFSFTLLNWYNWPSHFVIRRTGEGTDSYFQTEETRYWKGFPTKFKASGDVDPKLPRALSRESWLDWLWVLFLSFAYFSALHELISNPYWVSPWCWLKFHFFPVSTSNILIGQVYDSRR